MLDKYIVAVETNTAEENVILISRDDYNVFAYDPITGSDNKEEAEQLLQEVKALGVSGYFDKIISGVSNVFWQSK